MPKKPTFMFTICQNESLGFIGGDVVDMGSARWPRVGYLESRSRERDQHVSQYGPWSMTLSAPPNIVVPRYDDAVALLRTLSGPNGIHASLSEGTNYRAVFARDGVMAGVAGLLVGD